MNCKVMNILGGNLTENYCITEANLKGYIQ